MRWSAVALGAVALIALETLVVPDRSGQIGAKRIGGVFGWAASLTQRLLDPTIPGIGDRGTAGTTGGVLGNLGPLATPNSTTGPLATPVSTGGPCSSPAPYPSTNVAV